ncbi:long-chain-fatty-acid--CoA ligase [Halobacteriales archaeon Cl-PHB]
MAGTDLTIDAFLWRAQNLFPDKEIVSYATDGTKRYDYGHAADRVAQLANALEAAGVAEGDRVASCSWNHHRHYETYFGVPNVGAELHTVNPMLPDKHVEYMVDQAEDQLVFVDPETVGAIEDGVGSTAADDHVRQYVVMSSDVPDTSLDPVVDYETFIDGHDTSYDWPELSEDQEVMMCYTSGTTGKPKGVEYTQKMIWAHTMTNSTPQGHDVREDDRLLIAVPMFHVAGWCLPYELTATGGTHIYPGPSPSIEKLARIIEEEEVTYTAGVPTLWIDLLEYVEHNDADISSLERIFAGGAPVPQSIIRRFKEDHDIHMWQGWGMTETLVGSTAFLTGEVKARSPQEQFDKLTTAGLTIPGIEFRVVDDDGEPIPWDGEAFGELLVRGPWVITEYFKRPDANEENFDGDWLKTGDVATVDEDGYIEIVDRLDDLIKSGGEWISSVELENAIMDHEAVSEAVTVGVPHERYQERPVAFVVLREGVDRDRDDLVAEIEDVIETELPSWWTPDDYRFLPEVPRTSTGKFDKKVLRERYDDAPLQEE